MDREVAQWFGALAEDPDLVPGSHVASQPLITTGPENLVPSLSLRHPAYMQWQNAHTHK